MHIFHGRSLLNKQCDAIFSSRTPHCTSLVHEFTDSVTLFAQRAWFLLTISGAVISSTVISGTVISGAVISNTVILSPTIPSALLSSAVSPSPNSAASSVHAVDDHNEFKLLPIFSPISNVLLAVGATTRERIPVHGVTHSVGYALLAMQCGLRNVGYAGNWHWQPTVQWTKPASEKWINLDDDWRYAYAF